MVSGLRRCGRRVGRLSDGCEGEGVIVCARGCGCWWSCGVGYDVRWWCEIAFDGRRGETE